MDDRQRMLNAIEEVEKARERYRLGSDQSQVEKQHKRGKATARERMEMLFDPGTFRELELWAHPLRTGFDSDEKFSPSDAVVIGYGKVDGRTVMAYGHDFTVLTGSQSSVQHSKVVRVIDTAIKMMVPYVGIMDSSGIRVQDIMGEPGPRPPLDGQGLHGTGSLMYSPSLASGVIPQIALMLGPQFAGASYSPILKDFLIMRESESVFMALVSPPVIKEVSGAEVTYQEIGGAMLHAKVSGICDLVTKTDEEAVRNCRRLLSYFPSNWKEKPPVIPTTDDINRRDQELLDMVPFELTLGYDVRMVIRCLVDDGDFFEIKPLYADNVIIGFARLNGLSVGIVANNPQVMMGAIDRNSSDKAARFIRFCDAFNIPLVFLEDTVGYVPGAEQEQLGLARHAAKVVYAICEATVPKITVYLRNSSGFGELAMGTGQMGVDLTLAWPNARIGRVDPAQAAEAIYGEDIKRAEDPDAMRRMREKELAAKYSTVIDAGARQMVDDIIDPRDTRPILINALDWFSKKMESRPWKKHGNIPF